MTAGADDGGRSCAAQPPVLCRPQNGVSSLVLEKKLLFDGAVDAGGAVLGKGKPSMPMVLCVLYPSGTDFRTLMPTLSKEACVSAGKGGESGDDTLCSRDAVRGSLWR